MEKLLKKIKIQTSITLVTGLHIGGSSDNVEIGGIDNPVIKLATKENQPYIPGSSLKGKMRCLLEQTAGASKVGMNKQVNNLFGITENKSLQTGNQPSKLIVRDAMLTDESIMAMLECDNLDMPYTENKWENVIDRTKGVAEHPRQSERVPAGAVFNAEFIINFVINFIGQAKLFPKTTKIAMHAINIKTIFMITLPYILFYKNKNWNYQFFIFLLFIFL